MFQERHRLGGCGHSRALEAPDSPFTAGALSTPRLRAKWVGFDAALQTAASRAVAGAVGRFEALKNHAKCCVLQRAR